MSKNTGKRKSGPNGPAMTIPTNFAPQHVILTPDGKLTPADAPVFVLPKHDPKVTG